MSSDPGFRDRLRAMADATDAARAAQAAARQGRDQDAQRHRANARRQFEQEYARQSRLLDQIGVHGFLDQFGREVLGRLGHAQRKHAGRYELRRHSGQFSYKETPISANDGDMPTTEYSFAANGYLLCRYMGPWERRRSKAGSTPRYEGIFVGFKSTDQLYYWGESNSWLFGAGWIVWISGITALTFERYLANGEGTATYLRLKSAFGYTDADGSGLRHSDGKWLDVKPESTPDAELVQAARVFTEYELGWLAYRLFNDTTDSGIY